VNAVGASTPATRELYSNVIQNSEVYADNRNFALHEAGDIIIPIKEGVVTEHVVKGDFKDILSGDLQRRSGDPKVTVFKSLGMAIEDVGVAQFLYDKCVNNKTGLWVNF